MKVKSHTTHDRISALILVLMFLLISSIYGQELSKESLISDLTFLNDAVTNGHPVNYDPDVKVDILPVLEMAEEMTKSDLTPLEYLLWIEKGVYNIGCVHTSLRFIPEIFNAKIQNYCPFRVAVFEGNLKITHSIDSTLIGENIESINGIQSSEIIERFKEYKASDGLTDAFAKAYFHKKSEVILSIVLEDPEIYAIKTDQGSYKLESLDKLPISKSTSIDGILANGKNLFKLKDNYGVLKVSSFRKSDRAFFNKVFEKINDLQLDTLVLDLRLNGGGNRNSAIALTRFLVDEKFSYSILQPKHLKTFKYLSKKGKFFLFLSKLKYNIGDILHWRKNKLGSEFEYSRRPKNKNHFDGKVFVVTDGFTASASTMVTTWLKQYSDATFIGLQASGGYNGNNGGSFPIIMLPNSKIQIRFPAYRLILDADSNLRSGLVPEVKIDPLLNYDQMIELIKTL